MKTFQIAIYKPVSDITRAIVEIEAADETEALKIAEGLDHSDLEFDFHCCADNNDPIWREVQK